MSIQLSKATTFGKRSLLWEIIPTEKRQNVILSFYYKIRVVPSRHSFWYGMNGAKRNSLIFDVLNFIRLLSGLVSQKGISLR
jgi:hypothetical protein